MPTETPEPERFAYFAERIPGSRNHSPDGTWWGYNQTKIARYGDIVFMFVVENDDDPATESSFVVYKKEGDGPWVPGARFPTSRPGNILVDSKGGLHAFVFDPFDVLANDSSGSLEHYYFKDAGNGDIFNYERETVVPNDGSHETVNILNGASIGRDDSMVVAFGLPQNPPFKGLSEQLYLKRPGDEGWTLLVAGDGLDHYFYYSFPFVTDFGFSVLAIQDDSPAEGETGDPYYQIAAYFEYRDDTWSTTYVLDNSRHPEAAKRRRLVEISDNFQDSQGNIHLIIIDGDDGPRHYKKPAGSDTWSYTTLVEARNRGVSWIRLIEIDRKIYYVTAQWNIISVATEGGETFMDLDLRGQLGEQVYGAYLYIASSRSGTRSDSPHVDVLVLNGAAESYPNGENYYIRISKEFIKNILE